VPWAELTIWGVTRRHIPVALTRMARDRPLLRRAPGLRFAKSLGTGSGQTFTLRDADPQHWALLTVWDDQQAAATFRAGHLHRAWERLATERLSVEMVPVVSRGRWSRREPFAIPDPAPGPAAQDQTAQDQTALSVTGPVAAITRARLRLTRAPGFWRAVPPVSAELAALSPQDGLVLALGIGEAPIGLQGTFSLWSSQQALTRFAYASPAHVQVVKRTAPERWYAEELFARFAVRSVTGTYQGTARDVPCGLS
jgi:heme-degrading monooxygenase HmoA